MYVSSYCSTSSSIIGIVKLNICHSNGYKIVPHYVLLCISIIAYKYTCIFDLNTLLNYVVKRIKAILMYISANNIWAYACFATISIFLILCQQKSNSMSLPFRLHLHLFYYGYSFEHTL